ncbi:Pectinacetylesterase [Enhygromyxa salina]|uniref:Pectinacetylesterase n=2 Tax=Enhygromyxa salina TaxID=215803 RepID=A0A2S9XWT1_9BACT|nr:Pectinacetylesterase [Enhygromyxa salina]
MCGQQTANLLRIGLSAVHHTRSILYMRMKKLPLLGLLAPLVLVGCGDDPGEVTSLTSGANTEDTGDGDPGDGDGDPGDGDGDPDPGNPLPPAPVGDWHYLEIDGMFCRDGSPAGLAVRYSDNDSLLAIYMEGGGACFNQFSCLANPASVAPGKFSPGPYGGLFDNENPDNPLMDYNFVYMPYCTGDVFFGSQPDGNVPGGPQNQMFVGHDNMLIALERIADTFPNAADVVATGESGGGFGAAANYATIADAFPNNDVVLIDDSGPIFRDEYLAPCLQQQFRDVWNVDPSLPQDCAECFGADGGGLYNYLTYVQENYPNAPKGLISSHDDSTISSFFGFGANECTAILPSFNNFQEALYDLRDNVLIGPEFATYFKTGSSHTYLSKSDYYTLSVNGVLLVDWVADVIAGDTAHVAP